MSDTVYFDEWRALTIAETRARIAQIEADLAKVRSQPVTLTEVGDALIESVAQLLTEDRYYLNVLEASAARTHDTPGPLVKRASAIKAANDEIRRRRGIAP